MTYRAILFVTVIFLALVSARAQSGEPPKAARLNQIQVLGSHNSYKQAIEPELLKILKQKDARWYAALEYSHLSLAEQLDRGLRQLEIDVIHARWDPRLPAAA